MWVAVSVLLAHFCLQACANNWVWNKTAKIVALILGLECPNLILGLNLLILLKMCDLLKDLTSAQFNINALSLISWACVSGQKAKVGNGLGWPSQFSPSFFLPSLGHSLSQVLNPHPLGRWTWTTLHTTTGAWRPVTAFIRSSAFVLVVCLILFEEWVAKMVWSFSKRRTMLTKGELDPGCCFFGFFPQEIQRFLRLKKMEPQSAIGGKRHIFHIGFIFQIVSCFCIIGFLHSSLSNLVGFNGHLIWFYTKQKWWSWQWPASLMKMIIVAWWWRTRTMALKGKPGKTPSLICLSTILTWQDFLTHLPQQHPDPAQEAE